MNLKKPILFLLFIFLFGSSLLAQKDTLILKDTGVLQPNKKVKNGRKHKNTVLIHNVSYCKTIDNQ